MIYINFDETKRGLSFLGLTPKEQQDKIEDWLVKLGDIELHLGAQHEAVMLRILRRVREGLLSPSKIEFYCQGKLIPITPDGDFAEPIPTGFYNWRSKELF